MALNLDKTPFPYFGGKADASPHVWTALGDVDHYVEPFFGSGAVLIRRPHEANRTYYSETVNDLDGLLVNFWRALQAEPDALAEAASWPVSEIDLMARQIALVKWRDERMPDVLRADAHAYDVQMAGWWVWGLSAWIGTGWCGPGPWRVGDDGRVTRDAKQGGVKGQLPHLADNGKGVHHAGLRQGVRSKLPDLTTNGRGVLRPQLRDDAADEITMPSYASGYGTWRRG